MHPLPLSLLALLGSPSSLAQSDGAPAPPPPPPAGSGGPPAGPILPRVLQPVTAVYPPDALAEGLGAQVLLEVDVAADGKVIAVQALESSDPRFAAPAEDALRAFQFSPAIDVDGNPATARIQYRYTFRAERAVPLSAEGRVRDVSGEPIPSLQVTSLGPGGEVRYATTDLDGVFRFSGLTPGPWRVEILGGTAFDATTLDITVAEGTVQQVEVALERAVSRRNKVDLTILVEGEARTDQVTERVVRADEISYLPGTSGDVVKSVQNQPGVARAPNGIGQVIIRGTPPEDSEFGLDGASIPLVFHFAGLTTVLSTETVEEVAYLPGNYGVRYGRALGGYVDLRLRPGLPEENRSVVSVDVYQAQIFTERKLGDRTSLAISGRRSYIDAVLTPLLSDGEFTVQAPRYWDGQVRLLRETRRGDTLDALFFLSDDRFRFLGEDADGQDETLAAYATSFQKLRLRWLAGLGDGWSLESTLLGGPEGQSFAFVRDSEAYEKRLSVNLREELQREVSPDGRLGGRAGVDLLCGRDTYLYDVAFYTEREEGEAWFCAPGPYGEVTARLGRWLVTPGVRGDIFVLPDVTLGSVDPRLGLKWVLADATTLKAGTGWFHQFPTFRELNPDADGNPDLSAERAWQSSLSVEQRFGTTLSAEVGAFFSALDDLVVGREDRFSFFTGPPIRRDFDTGPYENAGTGLTCGAEVLARYSDDQTLVQLSATFSHSERTGRDDVTRLFEYDQPVNLNLLASRELPRAWRLGSRVRFGSGNPYNPVVNRVYRLEERDWIPVYDSDSSERLPPFFSLDLRVDRTFALRRWDLTAYLDVQNATSYQNVEVMSWSEDYSEEQPVEGLPVVPSFGLKGEW